MGGPGDVGFRGEEIRELIFKCAKPFVEMAVSREIRLLSEKVIRSNAED